MSEFLNQIQQQIKEDSLKPNILNTSDADAFVTETKYAGLDMLDAFSVSIKENTILGLASNIFDDEVPYYEPDETYTEQKKILDIQEILPDLRQDHYKYVIDNSNSREELEFIGNRALEWSRKADYKDELGFSGFAIDITSSLLDVPVIIGTSLISPVTATALSATKFRAMVSGGVMESAFQMLQDNYGYRERSSTEIILSSVFTGLVNGALTRGIEGHKNIADEIGQYQSKKEVGITDEVEERLLNATSEEEKSSILKEAYESKISSERELLKEVNGKEKLLEKRFKELDDDYKSGRISENAYNKLHSLRTDFEWLTKKSPSASMRHIGNQMFIDGTLQHNDLDFVSINETQEMITGVSENMFKDNVDKVIAKISKNRKGVSLSPKTLDAKAMGIFDDIAYEIQGRRHNGLVEDDDSAIKIGVDILVSKYNFEPTVANEIAKETLSAVKKVALGHHKIHLSFGNHHFSDKGDVIKYLDTADNSIKNIEKSLDGIVADDSYITTIYSHNGIAELAEQGLDRNEMRDYFVGSINSRIKKYNEAIEKVNKKKGTTKPLRKFPDQDKLRKSMDWLLTKIGSRDAFVNKTATNSNSDLFEEAFKEGGFTRKELDNFIGSQKRDTVGGFEKRKIPLDRSYTHTVDGKGSITIMDFVSKDYSAINATYIKKMSGRTAGQQYRISHTFKAEDGSEIGMITDLGTELGAKTLRKKILNELTNAKADGKIDDTGITDELARFDHIINYLHGKPTAVKPTHIYHKIQQIMRNMNIHRLLGMTTLPMTAELNNVIHYSGFRNYFSNAKTIKNLYQRTANGEIDDEFFKEARDFIGLAHEYTQGIRSAIYDHDFDATSFYKSEEHLSKNWFNQKFEKGKDKALAGSEKLAEFTMMVGGMKPYTAYMQMAMYTGLIKQIKSMATKTALSNKDRVLLKEMGFSDDMLSRIHNQISRYEGSKKEGLLSFDDWDDSEAKMMFGVGIKRLIDNVVLEWY